MEITLHKLARTTPAIRKEIQQSKLTYKELARKFGVSVATIYRWKRRDNVHDRSHARKNLLSSLSSIQEHIVVELRKTLGLSLDDVTEVMRRCINPELTRSSIYRAMKRCGVAKRPQEGDLATWQRFEETTEPGYIHMDVKYLTKLGGKRSYVYVAIDRLTRYVYVEVLYNLESQTAADFVERFVVFFPYKVKKLITDNGFEWTDRCAGGIKDQATGTHPMDVVCNKHDIKHKLTKIRRPQTNGMVERFNRRINEAIEQKAKIDKNSGRNSFYTHEERNEFIKKFVNNYNNTRLRCLNYNTPVIMLYGNHAEYNTYAGVTFAVLGCFRRSGR